MKKRIATILTVSAIAFGVSMPGASAARVNTSSGYCDTYISVTKTSTRVTNQTCALVQARIDRYVGGSQGVQQDLGPASSSVSYRANSNGTHAGNFARVVVSTSWSSWVKVG